MMAIKTIQQRHTPLLHTRENNYNWCKASNMLVLMSHQQINGIDAMSLGLGFTIKDYTCISQKSRICLITNLKTRLEHRMQDTKN